MRKLFYLLLFIPFFINLNVNATTMSAPTIWYHENGTAYNAGTAVTDTWGGVPVYEGTLIGRISTGVDITRVDFNYWNANLCSNKTLNIKGRLFGLVDLFSEVVNISVYNHNLPMTCSFSMVDGNQMDFDCYSDTGGGDLMIYLSLGGGYAGNFQTGISQNFDVTCDVTNEAIVNQSITNTQNIINNQNTNTNAIIGAVGGSASNIINNQNTNTDKEIESQYVCKSYDKLNIVTDNRYLNSNGNLASNNNVGVTDYIDISSSKIFVLKNFSSDQGVYACFYNSSKEKISCINEYSLQTGDVSVPANSNYVRFSIIKSLNLPTFKLCKNGNQAINESISDINISITSESEPDTSDFLSGFDDNVASDTPISDLITMPLTLINAYINGMNSACTPYNFGSLLGTNLTMPCINLQQRLGNNIWSIIDVLFSIFMIFNISKLFISAFNNFTSLKDDFSNMYTNDYQPKHGGDE